MYQKTDRLLYSTQLQSPPCHPDDWKQFAGNPASGLDLLETMLNNDNASCSAGLSLFLLAPARAKGDEVYLRWLYLNARLMTQTDNLDSAIVLSRKINELAAVFPVFKGLAFYLEGSIGQEQRQFQKAFRLAGLALEQARQTGDKKLEARTLSLIGKVTRDLYTNVPERCITYHQQALDIARTQRDTGMMMSELGSIALNYYDPFQKDKSLAYLEEMIGLANAGCTLRSRLIIARMTAIYQQMTNERDKGYRLFEFCVQVGKILGIKALVMNIYEGMAWIKLDQDQPDAARACLDSATAYSSFKRELGYYYRLNAETCLAQNQKDKAIEFYRKAFDEEVTGYTKRNTLQLTEWETEFKTNEKEQQLEQQKQRLVWFLILTCALFLFFAGAAFAYYKQREARKKLAVQHALIENQAAELRRIDAEKSRFFANIAHELRTPLTLIMSPANSLLQHGRLDASDREHVEQIALGSEKMLKMVNEMLDLEKLVRGEAKPDISPVCLYKLVGSAADRFEVAARQKGLVFDFSFYPSRDLLIATDENKLETLLNNLLSNAIRYTVTGSINLSVRMLDDWIEISVEDTGRGIHPDDQPRIFERYYQTQIKDLSIAGGTGIGLSLCKEIATLLGGDIRVESNWGKGSNFIFTFQAMLLIPEAKQMPAPAEPRPINPDMKATVLIVEDSYDLYKFMAAILQNQYNVIYAANGQAGWDLLEKMRKPDGASGIDMVISDLMMPVKDGYWLIGQIKSDPHFFILPVIVVTARNREDDKLSALRIGLDDYITKPFLEAELSARVETLMLHYKNRRESVRQDESDESDMNPEMVTDWLINLEKLVDERLHEPDFNIDNLSAHMGISSRQLLRKTRQYSGLTSSQFIQEMRMRRAKQLLESLPKPSVKEVSYAVGLRDPKYFSKEFLKRFGILPSDYTASPSSQISPELT